MLNTPTKAWRPRASLNTPIAPSLGLAELTAALVVLLMYSHFLQLMTWLTIVKEASAEYVVLVLGSVFLFLNANRTGGFREQRPVLIALFAYFAILLISIALHGRHEDLWLYKKRLAYVLTTAAIIVTFASVRRPKPIIFICQVVLAFSVAINLIEFFRPGLLPVSMTTVEGRAAGFYQNPNDSAAFIACLVPICCLGRRLPFRVAVYAVSLIGVYVTFSRGGLLNWAIAVALSELLPAGAKRFRPSQLGALLAFGLIAVIVVLGHDMILGSISELFHNNLDDNTASRMRFATNDASRERLYVAMLGLEQFARSPIFGQGVGFGFDWSANASVHNIFVLTLMESGIVGFIWLGGYLFAIASRAFPYGIWNVALFATMGMFNHNLFDGTDYGVIIALYCTIPLLAEREAKRSLATPLPRSSARWRPAAAALPHAPRRPWAIDRARPMHEGEGA